MKTILVVDDEYAVVESLVEVLEAEGYRVVSAGNGRDGLARVQKDRPDLVIVDLMMPISDGRELIRGMRATENFRSIPVIMMTAAAEEVALSMGLNASQYLQKPFRLEKLLSVIDQLLGQDAARGGNGVDETDPRGRGKK